MQTPWRRAGAMTYVGTTARLTLVTAAAALLLAAVFFPVLGITGIAVRDAANTFITLQVGKLGAAPVRSVMYDAENRPIAFFYPYNKYRVPVSFNQIAPVMRNAIVAIEDDTFYSQGALDPRATLRALLSTGSGAQLQGASTIAQQYVKNIKELQAGNNQAAYLTAMAPDLQRKVQQLRLAIEVEHELTPQQLLASYLNVAYFDNSAWGIQVASQVYFSKNAAQLTLPEAALLAGIVQSPSDYDPFSHPAAALQRRAEVLTRMWQLHYISKATALATEKLPLGTRYSPAPTPAGCVTSSRANTGFFCDYVKRVLQLDYPAIWSQIQTSGGLAIHTTLNMKDQRAANNAVNYVEAPTSSTLNPNRNADTEVLLQPGTGYVRAIAENRTYGPAGTFVDYAVNEQYDGSSIGVQTGSSSKIFTLITALKDNLPFGHTIKIKAPAFVGPFQTCYGQTAPAAQYFNSEGPTSGTEVWQMAEATALSINLYFVNLENQVGLCNVVKTAVDMGMTRADGTSFMKYDHSLGANGIPAYDVSSFTLGAVGVSPMNMAAAYASVAARGIYCSPQAITEIDVVATRQQLPVKKSACHRAMSQGVADAANYILQGTLTQPGATAANRSIPGYTHVAAKTGTANNGYYAAFAGYTRSLVSYTSVFNPVSPQQHPMVSPSGACYRDVAQLGGFQCPGQMFGDMAPGATWQDTFMHAALGPDVSFVSPPLSFFSAGNGWGAPRTIGQHKKKGPGKGGTGPSPSPTPTH